MQQTLGGGPRHFEAIELGVAVGDHIFVRRLGYTHHGVEVAEAMPTLAKNCFIKRY